MDQQTLSKLQELIQQGEKLVPEGGLEFSGYNAKMQNQYLMWRKNCLDALAKIGEKAAPFREKITKDENGAYFYQNSAQLILENVKLALPIAEIEAKKNSAPSPPPPKPAPQSAPKVEAPQSKATSQTQVPKTEPPQQKSAPQPAATAPKQENSKPAAAPSVPLEQTKSISASGKQVYVLSSSETELQNQLSAFLKEINIEPIVFKRGEAMDAIIAFLDKHPNVKYAYYLFNVEDVNNAMFELGYLVGKVGTNRVVCIHKKEDQPPKGIPGITYKEIVVKLEEISFGLIKELKAAGYSVSI